MRDGGGHSLPQAEGVPADKVCALAVGIIERVEEVGRRGCQQVPDVLLQHVDILARGILGHKAVIIWKVQEFIFYVHIEE